MRTTDLETTDIELASAIMTAAGRKPAAIRPGKELVEFLFPMNEITQAVAIRYAAGTLFQDVRRLANNRRWLYQQVRAVAASGKEVRP